MSDVDLEAQVSAAEAYEGLHVPALFRQWAPRVLDAASVTTAMSQASIRCRACWSSPNATHRPCSSKPVSPNPCHSPMHRSTPWSASSA